ncbi:2-amino-4-hydroxy-6-hydroxymethyldihydropteridinediphosphokinase [uncultured Gammaproteobacteria bacterium]
MVSVYLALGSNLGDRVANLRATISALAPQVRVQRLSPVYETSPMYVVDQPHFLNMAIAGETAVGPADLLTFVKIIEADLGREPGLRFGPRQIDIDILFYGDAVLALPGLDIPHPRLAERAFVLRPLADIASERDHPVLRRTVADLLADLNDHEPLVRHAVDPPLEIAA